MSEPRQRTIRRCVIGVLCLLVVGVFTSWVVAGWLIAPRPRVIGDPPADLPAISVSLVSDSGNTLAGWHIPSKTTKGVVVLLHPFRGSRLSMLARAQLLHAEGYSIVMIDLQAHGESTGDQITGGFLEKHDVRAAVEFARLKHPDEPIGIVGMSLGGASAVLASPLGIEALVLESVYASIDDAVHNRVAVRLGPFSAIPAELLLAQIEPRLGVSRLQLRPIDYLRKVNCPVLVMSGTEDRRTTSEETMKMFSAATAPKELWLVEGATHNDLYRLSPEEYKTRVVRFLKQHMRL